MNPQKAKNIVSKETKFMSNCSLSTTSTEGRLISVNEKYLAMAWKFRGEINIVDSNYSKNSNANNFIKTKEKDNSNILDIEFSPFDTNILSFTNENNSVIINKIVEENQKIILDKYDIYKKHTSKVNFVNFNPVASNIICSSTLFREVHIWDSIKFELYKELPKFENNPTSLLWAPNGILIGITTKKGFINIFDMREKDYIIKSQLNGLSQNTKMTFNWIDDNNIVIFGHNSLNERIMSLFDIRKQNQKMTEYSSAVVDKKDSPAVPFIDRELKLIYTVGKDNTQIHIYDYSKSTLKKLSHSAFTSETNICSALYPRKYLDKKNHEIDRIIRANHNNIFYTSFKIPNEKSSGFEGELYPSSESGKALFTCESWKEKIEAESNKENINDKNKIKNNESNKKINIKPNSERKNIQNQNNKHKDIKLPNTENKEKYDNKGKYNIIIDNKAKTAEKNNINEKNIDKNNKIIESKGESENKIEEFNYTDEKQNQIKDDKEKDNNSIINQNLDKNKNIIQKNENNEKLVSNINEIKFEPPDKNIQDNNKNTISNKKQEFIKIENKENNIKLIENKNLDKNQINKLDINKNNKSNLIKNENNNSNEIRNKNNNEIQKNEEQEIDDESKEPQIVLNVGNDLDKRALKINEINEKKVKKEKSSKEPQNNKIYELIQKSISNEEFGKLADTNKELEKDIIDFNKELNEQINIVKNSLNNKQQKQQEKIKEKENQINKLIEENKKYEIKIKVKLNLIKNLKKIKK